MKRTGKRLEFDRDLLSDMQYRPRRVPAIAGVAVVLGAVLVVATVAAVIVASGMAARARERDAIAQMAGGLITGLRDNDVSISLAVCAAGEPGKSLLLERLTAAGSGAAAIVDDAAHTEMYETFTEMRAELEQAGVAWPDAQPLAFGGVKAEVDALELDDAVVALIGDLYFTAGGRVYSVELSAWQCGGAYVVVDFWQWGPVDVAADAVKDHSDQMYAAFKDGPADDRAELRGPKHVFVPLT